MIHETAHPLAGKTVTLKNGKMFRIEDWWDRVSGKSWRDSGRDPAVLEYAVRAGGSGLPLNDEVVYGKIGSDGHLIHKSELRK
ncbi:hypothetical protein [Thalassobacillus pellis]|uniref:hypothetical protein n=1 Tax=Thalassobacillus pellis TaxID=748008 RepID=UPI00195F433C|nr:hypothetical protein [Thalassobacillus pellis]MBM7554538.1 hypothetical protein [Thalassobacillus pellis]